MKAAVLRKVGEPLTVEEIQIFATQLRTPDNKRVIVPNSSITCCVRSKRIWLRVHCW